MCCHIDRVPSASGDLVLQDYGAFRIDSVDAVRGALLKLDAVVPDDRVDPRIVGRIAEEEDASRTRRCCKKRVVMN